MLPRIRQGVPVSESIGQNRKKNALTGVATVLTVFERSRYQLPLIESVRLLCAEE